MAETAPVARSPIAPPPPVEIADGWEISRFQTNAALTLADRTPLAKVLVRADPAGPYARGSPARFGRAARVNDVLEIGSGVGEWLRLGSVGTAASIIADVEARAAGEFVNAVDLTHGRALTRLTGADSPTLLAKVCALDLDDEVTPDLSAFCSSVAKVVTNVVREDLHGTRSYLLHCERSSGQYLFDVLRDAGAEFGLEVAGFTDDRVAH